MKSDTTSIRWDWTRKQDFQPSPSSRTSMRCHKGIGVLFGEVWDYDESEENLDSRFNKSFFTFKVEIKRWYSQNLRASKKRSNALPKKGKSRDQELEELLNSILAKANFEDDDFTEAVTGLGPEGEDEEVDEKKDYGVRSLSSHERFNAAPQLSIMSCTFMVVCGNQGNKNSTLSKLLTLVN